MSGGRLLGLCGTIALLAGCATYQAYDGPRRSGDDVAVIEGSAKVRTQLPVALVIRAVDGREVGLQYSSVAVTPGTHELLVDCQVGGEIVAASRHSLKIEVDGGSRYRLTPSMSPGNRSCAAVTLDAI